MQAITPINIVIESNSIGEAVLDRITLCGGLSIFSLLPDCVSRIVVGSLYKSCEIGPR